METTSDDIFETINPKVFISYSWTTQQHQDLVKSWADRLLLDGVDVIVDIYDLKGGQDKYVFMEKMVKDTTVTNVLIFCDRGYAEKADDRERGVGTESQIISQEIYEQVEQTKFIPIVCGFMDDGTPFLPVFLKSRIWIDFSSSEMVNKNWEGLVRQLYGKPQHEKPRVGSLPAYLTATSTPPSPAGYKYDSLRQSILEARPSLSLNRKEFLDACIEFADELRVRERPEVENFGEKVLEDCRKLVPVRNHVVDWVLLESEVAPSQSFSESLIDLLERLGELAARPKELNDWNETWFEAHRIFVYETFLYIIAALLKTRAFKDLNEVFTSSYLSPEAVMYQRSPFVKFESFWTKAEFLNSVLSTDNTKYLSPAAEVVRRQANREDLPFTELIQADLLALLMSLIPPNTRWFPQLTLYASHNGAYPFFIRASQHKHFLNLATITGMADANELRATVGEALKRLSASGWNYHAHGGYYSNFWSELNLDNLDSL